MSGDKPDVNKWHAGGGRIDAGDAQVVPLPGAPPAESAPAFSEPRSYSLADLKEDRERVLLTLGTLPAQHGWGEEMDRMLGGGLDPGHILGIGAAGAGAGKTAWVMQLADGLALRSAGLVRNRMPGVVTPVWLLSEMDPRALARRSLGRFVRAPAAMFRSGVAAERVYGHDATEAAYRDAEGLVAPDGDFTALTEWQRTSRPSVRGLPMLEALREDVLRWCDDLARLHADREVQPVVVIDPIQRWQDLELPEVEALNALAEEIDTIADREGWIVFLTSDTTKAAAIGKESEDRSAAAIFRGSMKLFHAADALMVLAAGEYDERSRTCPMVVSIEKNRNGRPFGTVRYVWHPASGWFCPEGGGRSSASTAQPELPLSSAARPPGSPGRSSDFEF
jgi:hypothetical protein